MGRVICLSRHGLTSVKQTRYEPYHKRRLIVIERVNGGLLRGEPWDSQSLKGEVPRRSECTKSHFRRSPIPIGRLAVQIRGDDQSDKSSNQSEGLIECLQPSRATAGGSSIL